MTCVVKSEKQHGSFFTFSLHFVLVVVLVNFDFSVLLDFLQTFKLFSIAISYAEKFGFRFLQAVLLSAGTSTASSSGKEFSAAILLLKVDRKW